MIFLFFLPAGIANLTPVLASKIPVLKRWDTPLDFGVSWRKRRIFGDNKTWRGMFFSMLMGGIVALAISWWQPDIYKHSAFIEGVALGAGALLGDAVESFIKRQKGIVAGKSWFPFDQIDYIIGGIGVIYVFERPSLTSCLQIVIIYFGLHLLITYVGYLLKLRDKPI